MVWDYKTNEYVTMQKKILLAVEAARKEPKLHGKLNVLLYSQEFDGMFAWEVTKKTLLYAARKMTEIAHSYEDIDKAMMWGFNWELGPFALWDAIGLEKSVERMRTEGEAIPVWIDKLLSSGQKSFYEENEKKVVPYIMLNSNKHNVIISNKDAALLDLGDGVSCLEFRSKSNTITDLVVEMIGQTIEEVQRNYLGLVIGNQSKNFSVGADLAMIGKLASEKKFAELERIVHNFQIANMAIKYSCKPVVAAPYGMTLGGGAEIAMHSHLVYASAETYLGLVEVGVGLIPGGGGTKELLLKCTQELSETPENDLTPALRKAWETIATAKVSGSAHDAIKKGYLRKNDRIVMSQDYLIDEAKDAVLYLSESGFRPWQKKPVKVMGSSGRAALQYVIDFMHKGNFISEYDAYIAKMIARVMTGGDVPAGVLMTEEQILELEKEAFVSLCGEAKTLQRIEYMLTKGKPLRN